MVIKAYLQSKILNIAKRVIRVGIEIIAGTVKINIWIAEILIHQDVADADIGFAQSVGIVFAMQDLFG